MKKLTIAAATLLAALLLAAPASAQCVNYVTTVNGNAEESGCVRMRAASTTSTTYCCILTISDDSYAARVAQWAVELQLRGWLGKNPADLTRGDVADRRAKLKILCDWVVKDVQNKVFANAYLSWANEMQRKLDDVGTRLDRDEIAGVLLLHGLPTLPDAAK